MKFVFKILFAFLIGFCLAVEIFCPNAEVTDVCNYISILVSCGILGMICATEGKR